MKRIKEEQTLTSLFNSQTLGVLATENNSQPHTSLVAFVATEDLRNIIFATYRATRKFLNLQANPKVAMLIDSRSHGGSDVHSGIAVTAYGKAIEEDRESQESHLRLYLLRHPNLADFVSSAGCTLVNISIEKYSIASNLEDVRDLHIE